MNEAKTVVITGGARGIGLGLSRNFLRNGHIVTLCATSEESVARALEDLRTNTKHDQVTGHVCDVRQAESVEQLWKNAQSTMGNIDIWINNAGVGHESASIANLSAETCDRVISTNVLGTIHGMRVALQGMTQQGHGHIYNMEGLGSDGRRIPGTSVYGTSKRAIRYLTRAAIDESKGGVVKIGTLSPGMVWTDLLRQGLSDVSPRQRAKAQKLFSILADPVDVVTPWLVEQILQEQPHGAHISWLTTSKIIRRFIAAPFRRNHKS